MSFGFSEKKTLIKRVLETTLNLTAGIYKLSVVKTLSTAGSTTPSKGYKKNVWIDVGLSLQNPILFQILSFTVSKLNTPLAQLSCELSFRRHPYIQWWRWYSRTTW